jgi:hypothetical protein
MDSSTAERWLKVAFYGMAVLSQPSLGGANTTSTRSAVTKANTVDAGRRANESPPDVCPRQVQFDQEKPSLGADERPLSGPHKVKEDWGEGITHTATMQK